MIGPEQKPNKSPGALAHYVVTIYGAGMTEEPLRDERDKTTIYLDAADHRRLKALAARLSFLEQHGGGNAA